MTIGNGLIVIVVDGSSASVAVAVSKLFEVLTFFGISIEGNV